MFYITRNKLAIKLTKKGYKNEKNKKLIILNYVGDTKDLSTSCYAQTASANRKKTNKVFVVLLTFIILNIFKSDYIKLSIIIKRWNLNQSKYFY